MEGQRDVLLLRGLVAVVVPGLDVVAVRILLGGPTRTRRADGGEGQTHGERTGMGTRQPMLNSAW